ncbi:transcriptional regulatory protein CusR [bacterium BMS3Bbin14]|nr:transcriptional regulatory protein CusR [bacterium BMS3Abin13]GBE53678.1 transcriptional regulatory protein CusR [bacterium BMS3Bbin14]
MRVLLVEDDRQTAKFIVKGLQQEGFAVDHAAYGLAGRGLPAGGDDYLVKPFAFIQ